MWTVPASWSSWKLRSSSFIRFIAISSSSSIESDFVPATNKVFWFLLVFLKLQTRYRKYHHKIILRHRYLIIIKIGKKHLRLILLPEPPRQQWWSPSILSGRLLLELSSCISISPLLVSLLRIASISSSFCLVVDPFNTFLEEFRQFP